jgi:hypothetical protein
VSDDIERLGVEGFLSKPFDVWDIQEFAAAA